MIRHVTQISVGGVVFLGLGTLLHIVGTGTSKWTSVHKPGIPKYTHGLFEECVGSDCESIGDNFRFNKDGIRSVMVFATAGAAVALATTVLAVISLCFVTNANKWSKMSKILPALVVLSALAAASLILLSIIIHATAVFDTDQYGEFVHLSTSFVISTVGGIMVVLGMAIYVLGVWLILRQRTKEVDDTKDTAPIAKQSELSNVIFVSQKD